MAAYKRKTAEQKRKEVEELAESRNAAVEKYFQTPEQMKEYLNFMAKFYNYSTRNSVIIQNQFKGAEAVGSFKFWKDKGFSVQKGEKGIKILVPNKYKVFNRIAKDGAKSVVALKNATESEKQQIDQGLIKVHERVGYSIGHVFDVSQTDAKSSDLPEVFPGRWLDGKVENYEAFYKSLEGIAKNMNVEVFKNPVFGELGTAKGQYIEYSQAGPSGEMEIKKGIELNPRNSELNNVKTLIHELAHARLHSKEVKEAQNLNKAEKEFQAEMTAFTVCSHFNIDTSDYSLRYLHNWTNNHEKIEDKMALLEGVKTASYEFITHLENDISVEQVQEANHERNPEAFKKEMKDATLVTEYESRKIEDMSLKEFQDIFKAGETDYFDRFKDKNAVEVVNEFNRADNLDMGSHDNVKMSHPHIKEPFAFIAWSEAAGLSKETMNLERLDQELAKGNVNSLSEIGYKKTRIIFVTPEQNEVHSEKLYLGDGDYYNLSQNSKLKELEVFKEDVPENNSHLRGIYTTENIVNQLVSAYISEINAEPLAEDPYGAIDLEMRKETTKVVESFARSHDLLSEEQIVEIKGLTREQYEETMTTNNMVNLKGYYNNYLDAAEKESAAPLNEDNIANRMSAETAYESRKHNAVNNNLLDLDSISKMEKSVKAEKTGNEQKSVEESPFQNKARQQNMGFSM